jgi:hypothetical protein
LNTLDPKQNASSGPFSQLNAGLYGLRVRNLPLRGNSHANLLIAFSKLLFLCSYGVNFKSLRNRTLVDEMVAMSKAFFASTYSPPMTSPSHRPV